MGQQVYLDDDFASTDYTLRNNGLWIGRLNDELPTLFTLIVVKGNMEQKKKNNKITKVK